LDKVTSSTSVMLIWWRGVLRTLKHSRGSSMRSCSVCWLAKDGHGA
jgi:hypothetical protein